jgi:hypothetical protein
MGRDYYTWHETHIIYTDVSGAEVKFVLKEDAKQGHYAYGHSYDPDFEDPPSFDASLKQAISYYGTKWLYCNGEWVCKEAGQLRVKRILAGYFLPVQELKQVYKVLNGYWCDYSGEDWFAGLKKGFDGVLIVKDAAGELLLEDEEDSEEGSEEYSEEYSEEDNSVASG